MLLLIFLLIPNIFAAPTDTVGDYSFTIDDNVLTNIFPPKSINRGLNKSLDLSGQNIYRIAKGAFVNVSNIETLDLSKNIITHLDRGVFSNLRNLNHLSLAKNSFNHLDRVFVGLGHLKSLDISYDSLIRLGKSDLLGIPKSANINTTGNRIETISRALFEETYTNSLAQTILCQHGGIVSSLEHWADTKPIPTGCTRVQYDREGPYSINLDHSGISGFDKDWYRLHNTDILGLYLRGNNIVDITPEFISSLPYKLRYLDLSKNKIERVTQGPIVLRNLLELDLSENLINEVANDAFKHTSLKLLKLNSNRLSNIWFARTLPPSLSRLYLQNNQISTLDPSPGFSTLSRLIELNLAQNKITELKKEHLIGPRFLSKLNLSGNELKNIDSDCFERVQKLEQLILSHNKLTNLEYGVFHLATKIQTLSLHSNKVSTLPQFVFTPLKKLKNLDISNNEISNLNRSLVDLPNLKYLNISHNPIASAEKEDFIGVPLTVQIVSDQNRISAAIFKAQLTGSRNTYAFIVPILLCMDGSIVTEVREMTEKDTPLPEKCRKIELEESRIPLLDVMTLNLEKQMISGFAKNWYRLRVHVTMIILDHNNIVDVTSEMFNDLPKNVNYINMRYNHIERLKKGVIINEHLKYLNVEKNYLSEIEEDALVNTKLSHVVVSSNRLEDTRFVAGLPSSLIRLNAFHNELKEIPAGTFSRLNKLEELVLNSCLLQNIGPESFRGLSSLKTLSLPRNKLTTIDKGAFQHTKLLETLDLNGNRIHSMDKQLFSNLDKLSHIDLQRNDIRNITKDTFPDFPDSLESLDLQNNLISHIGAGSFLGAPKYELRLQNNLLTMINEGAFNLPDLVILQLKYNQLDHLNGEVFKHMPNLEELYLNNNNITKIDKGATKYLNKLYMFDLSFNPIKALNNGDLFGLSNLPSQKYEAVIRVLVTPLQHIGGGVFDDESDVSN